MSERPSFWQRLFGGAESSSLSQRQQKVMRYLIERMDKGDVPLQQALRRTTCAATSPGRRYGRS
jgi:hypothetical protein